MRVRSRQEIVTARLGVSNAHLILGRRCVLVDTGNPGNGTGLLRQAEESGIGPEDISLILLTHGHVDHFGSAAWLRERTGAPIAIHERDAGALRAGRNPKLNPTGLSGRLWRPFFGQQVPSCEPDITFDEEIDLEEFGVEGTIISTPGHTGGSVSVRTPGGTMIAGDLLMGGYMGGNLLPHRPAFHYFAEDLDQVRHSLRELLRLEPQEILVGHGGPLLPADVARRGLASQRSAERARE